MYYIEPFAQTSFVQRVNMKRITHLQIYFMRAQIIFNLTSVLFLSLNICCVTRFEKDGNEKTEPPNVYSETAHFRKIF